MSSHDRRLDRLLPVPHWPTASECAQSRWFSPVQLGPLRAATRTWVPAMVPWRATDDGFVTPQVIAWYRRFAEGRPGVIVVEATGIRDVPSGPLLRIGHDRFVPGLRALTDAVREASGGHTRLFIQLIDFLAIRRRVAPEKFLRRFVRPDETLRARLHAETGASPRDDEALADALVALSPEALGRVLSARDHDDLLRGFRERVTDPQPHLRDLPAVLPGLFAEAAERAHEAGFDGVELHYAHAYTMASFLSTKNTRTDGYGGPREHRVRLPLEVLAAVQSRVPRTLCVGLRLLGDEVIEGGSGLDDASFFSVALARQGAHFVSVSKGGKFEDAKVPKIGDAAYPYTGESGHECMPTVRIGAPGPFGRNTPLAARIRADVRAAGLDTPIVACGGIASFWQAEALLERGDADIVAAARQTLADPDWFEKLRAGRGEAIRRCFFTNYCEGLDQAHKEVTCQRWDRDFADGASADSKDGKRRLIAPAWQR